MEDLAGYWYRTSVILSLAAVVFEIFMVVYRLMCGHWLIFQDQHWPQYPTYTLRMMI